MKASWWRVAVLAAADATALSLLWPAVHRTGLTSDAVLRESADTLAADIACAGLLLAALWLGVGLFATALGALPGAAGRIGELTAGVLLPGLVRRLLAGGAGLGVLLAPVAAGAAPSAAHDPGGPGSSGSTRPSSLPPPVWPTSTPAGRTPVPTPTPTPTSVPTPRSGPSGSRVPAPRTPPATTRTRRGGAASTPRRTPGTDVTVAPGDSLWLIAQRRLGPDAAAARIAAYWPSVYRQNRSVIGDDPDLIRPGQRLRLPAPPAKETPR